MNGRLWLVERVGIQQIVWAEEAPMSLLMPAHTQVNLVYSVIP